MPHRIASPPAPEQNRGMDENPYRAPLTTGTCLPENYVKRSACYRSTPQHIRSFVGRWLYIYTDKGELFLTDDTLTFVGKDQSPLVISLDSIVDVRVGHYSRLAKPLRLDFIEIHYHDGKLIQATLLTPTLSWSTSTWETNRIIADWIASLQAARSKHI
jgi:hypothetical protein